MNFQAISFFPSAFIYTQSEKLTVKILYNTACVRTVFGMKRKRSYEMKPFLFYSKKNDNSK